MPQCRITCITVAITRLSRPDLTLSVPLEVLTLTMFLISGNNQSRNPLLTLKSSIHPPAHPFPVAAEATGLMGTAYLYPVPYQIVDTNRYPRNENILLLLALTLAYMDLQLYPRWDKQLLCSVCVGGCGYLRVSGFANRCMK